jgi:hypothetical protein
MPSLDSPRRAPNSAWHSGTISEVVSASLVSQSSRHCQPSSGVDRSQPEAAKCPRFCRYYKCPAANNFRRAEGVFWSRRKFFLDRATGGSFTLWAVPNVPPQRTDWPGRIWQFGANAMSPPGANRGRPCVGAARLRLLRRADIRFSRKQRVRAPPLCARRCRILTRHCGLGC